MRRRSDENQAEIIEGLRRIGCSVQVLSSVGHGCPDLLVGFRGTNVLIEVKNVSGRGRRLTEDEQRWHDEWRGQADVVTNLEEAIEVMVWRWNRSPVRAGLISKQNPGRTIESGENIAGAN